MTERSSAYRVSEHDEQAALFEWAALIPELRWMHAIPNGGARHPAVAGKLKAEGVKRGVADIFLPLPRGGAHGLYIELKAGKGRATAEQDEFIDAMRAAGYSAYICRGFEAARAVIEMYLER